MGDVTETKLTLYSQYYKLNQKLITHKRNFLLKDYLKLNGS